MKTPKVKPFYLFSLALFTFCSLFGQQINDCKVLNDELNGSYKGECLDGLAEGRGEFTFADGNYVYVGHFKKGKMDGEGQIFAITNKKRKSVTKGTWENNLYVGDKSVAYEVTRKINLDRYTVIKVAGENKVNINFFQNGSRNSVSNLNIAVNNGNNIAGSYTQGFDNIQFPFKCLVNYTTRSKLKGTSYDVRFEITINEPGFWEISLYN